MHKYVISTGTVTYAIKGRDILRRNGYKAEIQRSAGLGKIGCGYGVAFVGDSKKAEELLRLAGVKILETKQINE